MHARSIVSLLVLVLALLWPRVGHVTGSSTVTVASRDFSLTVESVRLVAEDDASEQSFHESWMDGARKEANGLRARLGGLWSVVVAANPRLTLLPYDETVAPEPCEGSGPCRLVIPIPTTIGQVELVVSSPPTSAQRTALAAAIEEVLERHVPVEPKTIVRDIIGLGRSFPHLEALQTSHFDGSRLRFEHHRTQVTNEAYDEELAAYEAEVARRKAEDADGSLRKRRHIEPPSTLRTEWQPHGVSLSVRFEAIDPAAPPEIRAAAGFVMPGYETITLQRFPGTEEADLTTWRVITSIEGDDVESLNTAIRDVLLMHGKAAGR